MSERESNVFQRALIQIARDCRWQCEHKITAVVKACFWFQDRYGGFRGRMVSVAPDSALAKGGTRVT